MIPSSAMPAARAARWFPPRARAVPRGALALVRRGVRHGWLVPAPRRRIELFGPLPDDLRERWDGDRPIVLPRALVPALARHAQATAATLALFSRARAGTIELQDEVWQRLGRHAPFVPAGTTVDLGDPREIAKVFVDGVRGRRRVARDLWAKLSWIAHDERDDSLRIRFSFGAEALFEWRQETARALWADRLAQAVFPECAALAGNRALVALVERLAGRSVRFSERIVYSNSPGGGAVFHHDAEPEQLGVLYGQLAGATAWLALPKRELAALVAEAAKGTRLGRRLATPARALAALDDEGAEDLARLLNETPSFTRRLVEGGHGFALRAGDALLLPNHGEQDTCWHSVFALGRRPSLSHSYGIYPRASRHAPSAPR
jgi:hypothetical protein